MGARRKLTPGRWAFLGVLLFAGLLLFLRTRWAWEHSCSLLRRELPHLLGLDVGINRCELDPLTQTATLYGVSAFSPGSDEPLFSADSASVGFRALQLTGIRLTKVELSRPRVYVDARRPAAATGKKKSCAMTALARVRVDRLDIQEATVFVTLPRGERVELSGLDVGWTAARGVYELSASARGGVVSPSEGRALTVAKLSLEGALDVDDEALELTKGELALDDATLSLTGRVEHLCEPTLALEARLFAPLATVARAAGWQEEVAGHLWSRASVSGPPHAPTAQLEVTGAGLAFGRFRPGDFSAHLAYGNGELAVSDFSAPAGEGTVRVRGTVKLTKSFPVHLAVETDDAQFGQVLHKAGLPGSWVDFFGSAKGALNGHLLPTPHLAGEVELTAKKFVLAARPFDAPVTEGRTILEFAHGHANARLAVHDDRVDFSSLRIDTGGSRVTGEVTLYYDAARGLFVRGHAEEIDLDDFGHISEISWSGHGSGDFFVEGPYADVRSESQLELRDFEMWGLALGVLQGRVVYEDRVLALPGVSGQKGKTQYFGKGRLRFDGGEVHTLAHVLMPKGRSEDVIDVILGLHPSIELFQGTLAGEVAGALHFDGPASAFEGSIVLDFKDTTYHGRRFGDGRMALHFVEGKSLVLDKTVLVGPLGTSSVEGSWTFAGPLDYAFRFEGASLLELLGPERAKALGVDGTLTLVGKVEGDATTPVWSAYLTSPKVTFANKNLGATHLEGRIVGRDAQVWGRPFADASGTMKLRLKDPFPYQATVTLVLPEIRPLLPDMPVSQGLSGAASGTLELSGNFKDAHSVDVSAHLTRLTLARGDFSGHNEGPVVFSWKGGRLEIDSFRFAGPNTELTIAGHWGPTTVDLKGHGGLDVRLFESFLPQIERSGGRVELAVSASGVASKPSLVGSAEIRDGRLSLRQLPLTVRALSGRVEFSEKRVLFQDVLGVLNDGKLKARGDVRLEDFQIARAEVALDFDDVSMRPLEYLPLTAHGSLLLHGKPEAMQLSGGVEVTKLRYEQSLELERFFKDVRSARAPAPEKKKEWLRFDVDIDAKGDVRVDNELARAKLAAKLKLTGTNTRPGLLGSIAVEEGGQAYYRQNEFALLKGELQFKDPSSIEAVVDLHAQARVRDYVVTVKAFGRLAEPKVVLSSEPSLTEADILSLLTLGVTSRDPGLEKAGYSFFAEAMLSATGLGSRVASFLPRGNVLRDFDLNLSTTYNEATGQVEPSWGVESKLLSEQLKLSLTQPVSGKGRRIQAEYRFTDRFSARAQWENDNQDYFGNPGLDLKVRFEVE
ncbi:MAG: translocation/assembly module TamB domain-containing protein [Myxococcota bacterium]